MKKVTKRTKYTPPSKNQTRPTSRRHAVVSVVCEGGAFHNDRLRVEVLPEQRDSRGPFGLFERIEFDDGAYVLTVPSDDVSDVRYVWQ